MSLVPCRTCGELTYEPANKRRCPPLCSNCFFALGDGDVEPDESEEDDDE